MEWRQQDEQIKMDATDVGHDANLHYMYPTLDDSIQLQSPEAIALNGLLSELEFTAKSYHSVAEMHFKNWENDTPPTYYTSHDCLVAYGIYVNKAQDMDYLVNKWKPNKK